MQAGDVFSEYLLKINPRGVLVFAGFTTAKHRISCFDLLPYTGPAAFLFRPAFI
jgi:hypothetical protein